MIVECPKHVFRLPDTVGVIASVAAVVEIVAHVHRLVYLNDMAKVSSPASLAVGAPKMIATTLVVNKACLLVSVH